LNCVCLVKSCGGSRKRNREIVIITKAGWTLVLNANVRNGACDDWAKVP